jgi:hypothetical protein
VNSSSSAELGARIAAVLHTKAAEVESTRSWKGPFRKKGKPPADLQCVHYRAYEDDDLDFHYKLFHIACDTCSANPQFLQDPCKSCQRLRLRYLLLCGPPYSKSVSDHLLGSKNGQTALCHIISETIRLELEVTGATPAKADADIKCAIVKANLPRGRREATFNIVVSAYDQISVQKVSFMQVRWYLE